MTEVLNIDYEVFKTTFVAVMRANLLDEFTDEDIIKEFYRLTELLLEENQKTNLTAITDMEQVITKHYCDCLKICKHIPKDANLLDVGCGGGFPTLPIAIGRKDINITALDSTAKKLDFVAYAAKELNLNVITLAARAEEVSKNTKYRERFDTVTARAVSRLNILSELCLPLTKTGGRFISMKGSSGEEELNEAIKGITLLGGQLEMTDSFEISGMKRYIFVVKKLCKTPEKYPRMYSKICKSPL